MVGFLPLASTHLSLIGFLPLSSPHARIESKIAHNAASFHHLACLPHGTYAEEEPSTRTKRNTRKSSGKRDVTYIENRLYLAFVFKAQGLKIGSRKLVNDRVVSGFLIHLAHTVSELEISLSFLSLLLLPFRFLHRRNRRAR